MLSLGKLYIKFCTGYYIKVLFKPVLTLYQVHQTRNGKIKPRYRSSINSNILDILELLTKQAATTLPRSVLPNTHPTKGWMP